MGRFLRMLLGLAVVALFAPSVMAANDCCWDWSPFEQGAEDEDKGPDPKVASETWALCNATAKIDCFKRKTRQMIWINWQCLVGPEPSPSGDPNPFDNAGFYCLRKDPPPDVFAQELGTDPPVGVDDFDLELPVAPIPVMSNIGLIVLALLIGGAAVWMIRRRAVPA